MFYLFSTTTIFARTHLIVALYIYCLSFFVCALALLYPSNSSLAGFNVWTHTCTSPRLNVVLSEVHEAFYFLQLYVSGCNHNALCLCISEVRAQRLCGSRRFSVVPLYTGVLTCEQAAAL
jgi:hypothetical protein